MKRTELVLFALLSLLALGYLAVRIWFNPLVNDEAYSFLHFVFTERFIPFLNAPFPSANNHILNSFLSWVVYRIFGVDEVWLRLPNFIAFVGLLLVAYRLGKMISSAVLRWFFWIMIIGSAPILEFFTYSRGYGLSFTLLIGSIYFLYRATHEEELLREWQSWLLMVLAVFANLNMLHSYLIWLMFFSLIGYRQTGLKKLLPMLLVKSLPLLYFIPLGIRLRQSGELYFGTDSGINKSINSLLEMFFGETARVWDWMVLVLIVLIALTAMVLAFKRNKTAAIYPFAAAFLVLNVLGAVLQHIFLDVLLPVHRSILHWYLLFILAAYFGLDYLARQTRLPALLIGALLFSSLVFQIHNYDLFRSSETSWRNEQITEDFYDEIKSLSVEEPRFLTIETNRPEIEYTWNFLNLKNGHPLNKIQVTDLQSQPPAGDVLLTKEGSGTSRDAAYKKVHHDPKSRLCLLQRKKYLHRELLQKEITEPKKGEVSWVKLFETEDDIQNGEPMLIDLQMNMKSCQIPPALFVQLRFLNSKNEIIEVKQLNIEHLKTHWEENRLLHFSHILYLWPRSAVKMDCGIYNPEGHHLQVDSAECSIFKLFKKS